MINMDHVSRYSMINMWGFLKYSIFIHILPTPGFQEDYIYKRMIKQQDRKGFKQ
jgi:hypothetical protein